ncbi:tafazzin-like isoform X1 [Lytechinus variegatus]|uniref:tafazzin-like isoform X1 n=1 Tax=Lytechinus variegatus TaxID=7654 RepID=UPI001BB12F19|nr:tafazzin-like isoform X1 [Lytechinus variegatus]
MPLEKGQWVFPCKPGVIWKTASQITICTTYLLSKFWLSWVNQIQVHHKEILQEQVEQLHLKKRPLITVANHTSSLDDCILCGLLKFTSFCNLKTSRWTPGASEIAFIKRRYNYYFSLGQVVPVLRGDGVYQRGMDFCLEKLNNCGWTNIYAEGKVNMTNDFLRLKWGVGRLISECKMVPLVVPIWHIGMDDILPNYPPYIPRRNKKVTVVVGQPLDLRESVEKMKAEILSPLEMRKKITDAIQEEMKLLKAKAEALHTLHIQQQR